MLIVSDADAAVAWYRTALGATELWNKPLPGCRARRGGVASSSTRRDPRQARRSARGRRPCRG
ncbi:VOC family protein [Dactylosporangium sp. NPDC050588]|uniref:VOC family protein n=1 Tax=Dactylosporangium sp. NPDC050588 TaxID=3157211 RepID=UPI003405432D